MAIPLTLSEVPNLTPYVQYVSGSGQTVFPYPFPITQDSDLVVVVNGVTLGTDAGYTLSGQGNDTGGNLTFTLGQTAGAIVTLFRDIAIQRITQIGQNSGFSSTAFNAEFNNLYLITQQLEASIAQCLQIPNTNNPAPITTLTKASYANLYLSFDANGNPQPAALTPSGSVTSSLINSLINLTITQTIASFWNPQTPAEQAAGVTPVNYAYPPGWLPRYGTNTTPGTTDMTVAVQAALSSNAGQVFFPAGVYLISSTPFITTSGLHILGYGATLKASAKAVGGLIIGYNGSVFTKTDNVTIEGLTFLGVQDGTGSTPSFAVVVQPPTTNPYVYGGGCSNPRVINCTASGHTGFVQATGADGVLAEGNTSGSMQYLSSLGAGGYGVLLQTCFDTRVAANKFLAATGDRHAVYVSADPNRTFDNNNVCKGVAITGNTIDWSNVSGITGFEACMVLRSPENISITGNTLIGGYGGIDYDSQNGNGTNITITGNTFDSPVSSGSQRACITFLRTANAYIATGVTICGNSMVASGANLSNIQLSFVDHITISGNNLHQTNGVAVIGVSGSVTHLTCGPNDIFDNNAGGVYVFSGAGNANITINKDLLDVTTSPLFVFTTTPTNLTFGFTRSGSIRANSTASPIVLSDPYGILSSVASDTNGIVATFAAQVSDVSNLNMLFGTNNSNVVNAYYRSVASQAVTIGVLSAAGAALPAASNTYDITISLAH